ncbi:uncharacterized protein PADG_02247 [Paracoccidioides brasiliensis Pb18]|uniref:DUF1770 domain-containing protein n=2 Tax=Paracoccidioides brasiliensis TaxID=121759 RepID=C1G281_PARBD|nr:uncharacterized protein PADG_02247 [Paracoccidioides brasiliensis Pb18]EEH46097.2 hypothetical protein PADG_02247 [Paracoccidioides brasiliensis Pb18]ODH39055.1 hypothetical protein ACO22_02064 [Paracoccidioides brasiliensis]ODH51632.1 hypothetical protein GX48_02303 [Paracoccidioides brasiliensis]
MTDTALQLAETLQTASINPRPSPAHDINPSTAVDEKEPVAATTSRHRLPSDATSIPSDIVDPSRTIRPLQRAPFPPLPDLRFEQSYLASLKGAQTWQRVVWITVRDQIFLPLIQGTLWTLALAGWRHWNRGAQFTGRSLGTRIRRWWWNVNNWKIPQS